MWSLRPPGIRLGAKSNHQRAGRFTPDSKVIGANALFALLDAAQEQGFERDVILAGLSCRAEALGRLSRVSWRDLALAIENLERAGMTSDGFEAAGARVGVLPHFGVQAFAEFFLRPEHILLAGLRWVGPAMFPVFDSKVQLTGRTIRLELVLPAEFPGSVSYFHICRGTLSAVPRLVGQPKAAVSARISPHTASFDIQCAPMLPGSWRLGRIVRAVLSTPRVVEALAAQEATIRRAFELASESQLQFRRILGALPDGVAIVREDRILYANPRLADIFGADHPSGMIGASWSALLGAADSPTKSRAAGDPPASTGQRVVRRSGQVAWVELSAKQDIDYEELDAELVVVRDVTERHELQERLALADRTATLGTLAAGIAHEINNPLALVIGNLELARSSGEAAGPLLDAAADGAERVRDIVRDLRVFSKPDTALPVPVDLASVIESSLSLARGKTSARASVVFEAQPVPAVLGREGRLGQVVLNLVLNALEAMPEGRPVTANRIVVRLLPCSLGAAIEVADNGAGIPTAVRDEIFQPFFTTRAGGSGLGLPVTRDIVTSFGGTLVLRSEEGVGSTFRVELPRADALSARADTPVPDAPPSRGRILVADDEPSLLRVIEAALEARGHQVVCVRSGNEAFDALRRDERFDLVLCDVMMPDGSGQELYARLCKENPAVATRMVFMTGGTFRGEVRSFLASLARPCLEKPFRLDELDRVVAEGLLGVKVPARSELDGGGA